MLPIPSSPPSQLWVWRYVRKGFLGILTFLLLAGLPAGIWLVSTNQDLRQQAAFFNFGGDSSDSQVLNTLILDGHTTSSLNLSVVKEPYRKNQSVIIANGAKSQLSYRIRLGNQEVKTGQVAPFSVEEFGLTAAPYFFESLDSEQRVVFSSGLGLDVNQSAIILRINEQTALANPLSATGGQSGYYRVEVLDRQNWPLTTFFNLTPDNSLSLSGENLKKVQALNVPANTQQTIAFTNAKVADFSIASVFPNINQRVRVENAPLQRLLFFALGDTSNGQLSLATIPLPPPLTISGDQTLDDLVSASAPMKSTLAYLESQYATQDNTTTYFLRNVSLPESAQKGFVRFHQLPKGTVVWSVFPRNTDVPTTDSDVLSLVALQLGENEYISPQDVQSAPIVGEYFPTLGSQNEPIWASIQILDFSPDSNKKLTFSVLQAKTTEINSLLFGIGPAQWDAVLNRWLVTSDQENTNAGPTP